MTIGDTPEEYPLRFKAMDREAIQKFMDQSRLWWLWTDMFNFADLYYSEPERKVHRIECEWEMQSDGEGGTYPTVKSLTAFDEFEEEIPLRLPEAEFQRFFVEEFEDEMAILKQEQDCRPAYYRKVYPPFEGEQTLENQACRDWILEKLTWTFLVEQLPEHVSLSRPVPEIFKRIYPPPLDPRWADMTLYYAITPLKAGEVDTRDTSY